MNDPRYNAVPNPAYATEVHWCNYCDAFADHLSSGHPDPRPMWRVVDSHECTVCGFLDRSRDGIMAHLATCGAMDAGANASEILTRAMRPFYGAEFLDTVVDAAVDALTSAGVLVCDSGECTCGHYYSDHPCAKACGCSG